MAEYSDILKKINSAIKRFNKKIPGTQSDVLDAVIEDLRRLDIKNGRIKATVKNLSVITSIKNKLTRVIVNEDYKHEVKEFARAFNDITQLQNTYWKQIESTFKPRPLLKEIKNQAITDTVNKLMDAGINANVADPVTDILRQNITSGGSMKSLTGQLREFLTNTKSPGGLQRYARQITTDSINQFSAQYSQIVSSDLGYEFFNYAGTDIETTRPWCDAMSDRKYFHVSEIPALLRADGLTYTDKTGSRVPVPIYKKTGLPHGMYPGTDASNLFVRRGGYNCGHQIRPMSELLAKKLAPELVFRIRQTTEKGFDTTQKIKFNIERAAEEGKDAMDFYRDPATGALTKDRQKLHKTILKDYLKKGSTKLGTSYLLGGAPASGKSVLTKSGKLPFPRDILVIDADSIKDMIPDYAHMLSEKDQSAAAFVHEESSILGKEIVDRARALDYDTVLDGVGNGDYNKLVQKVQIIKKSGKNTRADYVTCDTQLTVDRAIVRAEKTGRFVPISIVRGMNKAIANIVPKLVKDNVFDELYLWDTNDSGKTRLILSQVNGKLSIKDQDLYDRFLAKQNE